MNLPPPTRCAFFARISRLACGLLVALATLGPAPLVRADDLREETAQTEARADAALNRAFQRLIRRIRAEHARDKPRAAMIVARLRESQRAWLQYRDAQVAFVATYHDIGSASARAAGAAAHGVKLTEARIQDFEKVPDFF